MIADLLTGLEILRGYQADAPIITKAYYVLLPSIPFADVVGGTDATDLAAANWVQNTEYACYCYKTATLAELL